MPAHQVDVVDTDDALGDDDATAILARLSRREVSVAELHAAAARRLRRAETSLDAVACWVEPDDLDTGASGPLAGLPVVVKDNEDLAGYPTSQGSRAPAAKDATADSPWVGQFRRLGAVPLAKSTLPEFGLTASTESQRFGATRNPWATDRSTGGSSGGSAALVACGAVPMAHANDGGGSIRIPAACCGLVGLKPTRGRLVERPELDRLPVNLAVQGVLTRTVRDTALYYALAEQDWRNPALPPIGHVNGHGSRRLRVGLMLASAIPGLGPDADTSAAVRSVADTLTDLGHEIIDVDPPADAQFGRDFLRYWSLLGFIQQRMGRVLFGEGFEPSLTERFTQGLDRFARDNAPRIPGSLRRLRRLATSHEGDVYERVDVLLSPVLGHEPPRIGYLGPDVEFRTHLLRLMRYAMFTPLQNVTGSPAISLPLGRSGSGLPIGVHLAAPFGHERRLLELAYELEAARPWPVTPRVGPPQPASG